MKNTCRQILKLFKFLQIFKFDRLPLFLSLSNARILNTGLLCSLLWTSFVTFSSEYKVGRSHESMSSVFVCLPTSDFWPKRVQRQQSRRIGDWRWFVCYCECSFCCCCCCFTGLLSSSWLSVLLWSVDYRCLSFRCIVFVVVVGIIR